jgi:precorrin-6B methylase 2
MAGPLSAHYAQFVRERVAAWQAAPDMDDLNDLLRALGRWRSKALVQTFLSHAGPRIAAGPFAGMEYVTEAAEGALMPRLLGAYEAELHPYLHAIAAEGPECVIDVGCAEGYYAVGLARLMPQVTVYAFDIDPRARAACADLAARNGVSERVVVGGEFPPTGFQAFAGARALVMVDAEGAEVEILQPALSPALEGMTIIVETHDLYRPGALALLTERFSPTHRIVRVDHRLRDVELPGWLRELPPLDQLLAVWEWRAAPTPWLVMHPRGGAG